VAERTELGWVPLYPAVSGISIERGSVLSHAAVISRETGIPTIVGITGILKAIKDGVPSPWTTKQERLV
jgi:rifampicin phosphotransferase